MLSSFFIPFITILFAEFLDKSQLALFMLSGKTKHHTQLFFGAMLAFSLVDGIAILAGSYVATLLPIIMLKILSGLLFIFFGILSFKNTKKKTTHITHPNHAFAASFSLILTSEWGDKTQLAAAVFATQYNMLFVFLGVLTSLGILSVSALFLGSFLAKRVEIATIHALSGVIFVGLGFMYILFSFLPASS